MRLHKLAEAEHWYKESLRAKPDHIPAHLTYGKLLAMTVSSHTDQRQDWVLQKGDMENWNPSGAWKTQEKQTDYRKSRPVSLIRTIRLPKEKKNWCCDWLHTCHHLLLKISEENTNVGKERLRGVVSAQTNI